ncbi:sushi, von Willebrand factor type A, EGF and pentraxin domain-containing protein 1-like [Strongylocentrotus purpuratus]|uniref:Uncharacterized protein n=1 Tax=Strongylocentrotus purpuratus TaxID=7668 RepID=A0A7M7N8V7_STRPU|nr:sushi, von Willebrand factor type A, EGF and pentraxin domain-containing protein 1-like [Strongylocentrotus purpuratus]
MIRLMIASLICVILISPNHTEAFLGRRRRRIAAPPPPATCQVNYSPPLSNTNNACPSGMSITQNTQCDFTCPTGYNQVGSSTVYCQSNGLLSDQIGCEILCEVNYTLPVTNTNNACPAGTNITENTQCDFTCPTGYNLVGSSTVYCQTNGELSDQIGCELITCPVSNYTSPLIGSCESNSTVDWSTECTFGCAEGYLLEGDDTSSCGVNGQLNGSLPTCTITCQVNYTSLVTNINNACPAGINITEDTQCDFTCPTGYNLIGNSTVYCQSNGQLSDQIGCEIITCPVWNYTWPLIGSCDSNSTVDWSTECTFGCAEGYLFAGDDTTSCGVNGQLNGSLPTCTITCQVNYTSLVTNTNNACPAGINITEDTQCDFACPTGYNLIGSSTVYCQSNGQLSDRIGCEIITCPVWNYTWPLIGSCDSNSNVDWSTECTFGCAEGYLFAGDDTTRCGVNGQLNGSLPTCTITCQVNYISPVTNTNNACPAGVNITEDTQCDFTCPTGYNLIGSSTVYCQSNGQLSDQIGCEIITCPVWNYIWPLIGSCDSNSNVDWSTECTFECAEGYLFAGDDTTSCGVNGQLNGSLPTCTITCQVNYTSLVTNINNACPAGVNITEDTQCDFTCPTGYNLVGSSTVYCQSNGELSDQIGCEIIKCQVWTYNSPLTGTCISSSVVNWQDECVFDCSDGYALAGDKTTLCQLDGQLEGSLPTCLILCEVNYTPPVNNPNNACPAGTNITENTQCDFTCPTGYNLVGSSTVYCQTNGELSDQIGCEIIKCQVWTYKSPLTGLCVSSSVVNWQDECVFDCSDGYALAGDKTTVCQLDGQLEGSLPTCLILCEVNYTPPLNNPNNACPAGVNITEDTQCDFTCPTGYNLVGSSTVYCQTNGELSDQNGCEILCEVSYLPPLDNTNNACPAGIDITENTQCDFTCPFGYKLVGNSTVYCQSNGQLSDNIGCSNINKCSTLPCSADVNSFCVIMMDTFQCNCYDGFENSLENSQCNPGTPTVPCQTDSCMNGGTCNQEPTTFTCTCLPGFTGLRCQNDLRCNDVLCEDTQACYQGVCVCRDGTSPVNGICSEQCSSSCSLEQERCMQSSCQCRPGLYRKEGGQGVAQCIAARRLLRTSFIIRAINDVPVNFNDAYSDPQSKAYIAGAEAIRYVMPRLLSARGFRGVINAVLLGYFQGSLGVDFTVSGDETFVGNATTLMNALLQESMDSDGHLIADNTTLLINMASLSVTEITDVDECAEGSHDCAENALCINTDPGLGFECLCNEGYDDLYPATLPGRYCIFASDTPDNTINEADDSLNVGLIAGLVPGLGFALVLIIACTAYACMNFVRIQREKNMAQFVMKGRPPSFHHSSGTSNDQLSYRIESSQSDVYYHVTGSDNTRFTLGTSQRSGDRRVPSSKRSVSSVRYSTGLPPRMGSSQSNHYSKNPGSDIKRSIKGYGQRSGDQVSSSRRSASSGFYNNGLTIHE